MDKAEFTKGDTEQVGDCGKYESGINHLTIDADKMLIGSRLVGVHNKPAIWHQRIIAYGNSVEETEALRDRIIAALENEKQPALVGCEANPIQRDIQQVIERNDRAPMEVLKVLSEAGQMLIKQQQEIIRLQKLVPHLPE